MTPTVDHSLNLDKRQRDMLAAMGVTYWWPDATAVADIAAPKVKPGTAAAQPARRQPAPTLPSSSPTVPLSINKIEANSIIKESDEGIFYSNIKSPDALSSSPTDGLGWSALTHAIQHCTACGLCEGRKQAVTGMGNAHARWMIVGETPDDQADAMGQPFVGPVGQMLDAMLAAMGLNRETDVYVTNVIKCHPTHNRNPEPAEIACCAPYLQRQIELVQPDMVIALGRLAGLAVLAGAVPELNTLPLGKLRAQVHTVANRAVVVTYHPNYLLRSPAKKADVWSDLCLAMAHLGYNPLEQRGN